MICGQLFDEKYRILRVLGQGGMGRVYLAENIKLGTLWAIKEVDKHLPHHTNVMVEPNILKKLNHPALPRVFDIIEDENFIYVIVDYIEGVSLDRKLSDAGKFPEENVIEWARQICDVLNYLHSFKPNPIIYRDMKPSNIILTGDGFIKLIDFGIAREYKTGSESDTIYIGTRGYAAPEQYGAGQTGVASDIYSLGVTLHHLVTGKSPNEPPYDLKPARYYDEKISSELEFIISKCTRQDPAERYQSANELLGDLNGTAIKQASDEGDAGRSLKGGRKRHEASVNFKRLVLTVWDNAEFGCELAYTAARLSEFSVMLMDLDLLEPKVDLLLNVKKTPDRLITDGVLNNSGLGIIMDSISRNCFNAELLAEASVKRRELGNLFILTGSYRLDSYEYYCNDSLTRLIEKSYQHFDITVLLVNRSVYDSYTIISLAKSDFNIIAPRADIDELRVFNRYLAFLRDMQHIPLSKTRFVAFGYDPIVNLREPVLDDLTGGSYLGHVRRSRRREKYRNLKAPYAKRMEKEMVGDYSKILTEFGIIPRKTPLQVLSSLIGGISRNLGSRMKSAAKVLRRKTRRHAGNRYAS